MLKGLTCTGVSWPQLQVRMRAEDSRKKGRWDSSQRSMGRESGSALC